MVGNIVRGLITGAALLSLAVVTRATGVLDLSDVALGLMFVTLFLLLAFVLFDDSWDASDAPGDAVAPAELMTGDGGLVADPVVDAGSTAA